MKIMLVTKSRLQEFKDAEEARKVKQFLNAVKCPYQEMIIEEKEIATYGFAGINKKVRCSEIEQ